MKNIVYIHGAFSSGTSFQRIKEAMPEHHAWFPQYDVSQPLDDIIQAVDDIVSNIGSDVHIVSHSLGGVVGVGVAHLNPAVRSVLTMSSPFGGSRIANTLKWFNSHQLYRTLTSSNQILHAIKKPLAVPLRSIITTVGNNPMMFEKNDGVVSLKSQNTLPYGEKFSVPLNHFEVLLSNISNDLIRDFTFK